MAMQRVGEKALAVRAAGETIEKQLVPNKPPKNVLDEETYTEVSNFSSLYALYYHG